MTLQIQSAVPLSIPNVTAVSESSVALHCDVLCKWELCHMCSVSESSVTLHCDVLCKCPLTCEDTGAPSQCNVTALMLHCVHTYRAHPHSVTWELRRKRTVWSESSHVTWELSRYVTSRYVTCLLLRVTWLVLEDQNTLMLRERSHVTLWGCACFCKWEYQWVESHAWANHVTHALSVRALVCSLKVTE